MISVESPRGGAALPAHTDRGEGRAKSVQAGRLWAWVPALLLVGLVGTQLVVLARVLEDPSFAIEKDYYQQAVDWDAHQARQRRSRALGWQAKALADPVPASGLTRLSVRLTDARGQALVGAQLSMLAFANTRSAQSIHGVLKETTPGFYEASLGRARSGLWEVRLNAVRGADVYEAVLRLDVNSGEAL
jgi:nitrogen fixation protein FixH